MLEVRAAPADTTAEQVDVPDSSGDACTVGGQLARAGRASRLAVADLAGERLAAFVEGLVLGAYRFRADPTVPAVDLCGVTDEDALARGRQRAATAIWARELANTRSNVKTPAWLGERVAAELRPLGVEVTVRDVGWLTEQGFGGVLAVGGGSTAPPRLLQASWRPRDARPDRHVVLVGKGITFDTGGVNRKTGDGMRTMHTDMAGGAAVLAALRATAQSRLPLRVTAIVPAAENSLSGSAFRPGDVVRHYGGRTSEIGNTDAEGRLVLADALSYAAARLRPTHLVDLATLTGAMRVALGVRMGGLFATSDELADGLVEAGTDAGEPLWRMPLPADYEFTLRSDIADATNMPGNPGAITAALFLRPFTRGLPWAHLDIAGPARATEDDGLLSRGATGFGARLLARWLSGLP